jgi:hypothetical protein
MLAINACERHDSRDTTRPVEALAGHAPLPRFFGFEINTLFPAVTTLSTALPSATFVQVAPAGTTQFDCMFLPESVREKVSCAPGTTDEPAPEPF